MSKKADVVSIQDPGLVRVEVTCVGLTPMLQNRMSAETLENIRTKAKKPKSAGAAGTPREEAAPKVYTLPDGGGCYVPTENLLSCLIAAGQYVRLDGKRQVSTAKATMLPAFLSLEDPVLPLLIPDTTNAAPWEVDIRAGRNPNGGEAVCLCRPRFDRWQLTVTALVDTREVNIAIARELFDIAGKRIGLGDFRPQKKGMFGRFVVQRWAEQRERVAA
jgi:hypothetical protein